MAFRLSDRDRAASQAAAAIRQANRAQRDYEDQAAQAQANLSQAQSRPMGGLESVLAGIGEKFNDWGNTIGNIGRTVIGSVSEPFSKAETDRISSGDSARRNEIAKKYGFSSYSEAANSDRASQDFWNEIKGVTEATQQRLKNKVESDRNSLGNVRDIDLNTAKGQALSTASDVLQALGPIGNVVGGVAEGVGSSYKNAAGGTDADVWGGDNLGRTLGNAAIGGATAFIGDKVGGRLASKAPGNSLLSRAIHSNVGRGTIAGAAAGATGGGLGAALNGGDVLQGTLQGAQSGAMAGGTMAGTMGVLGSGIDRLNRKYNAEPQAPDVPTSKPIVEEVAEQYTKPATIETALQEAQAPTRRQIDVQYDGSGNGNVAVNRQRRDMYRLPDRSGSTLDGVLGPNNKLQLPNAQKPTDPYAKMTDIEVLNEISPSGTGKRYTDLADAIESGDFLGNDPESILAFLKEELPTERYNAIKSAIDDKVELDNMFSNEAYGIRKSDLPMLNRDEYYYDTIGRLGNKGNGNMRAEDVPKSMYNHLRNSAGRNSLGGSMTDNENIMREAFGDIANGKDKYELYDMYQQIAEAPGPRKYNVDDIVAAVTNTEYNDNIGDKALNDIVAPFRPRQIGVQGAPSIADSIDVSSPNRGQIIQDVMPAQRQTQPQMQAQPIQETPVQAPVQRVRRAADTSDVKINPNLAPDTVENSSLIGRALKNAGNDLQAAQTNITRAERRKFGIKDAGETVNALRKRTGFSNLDDQAEFAKNITGGQNSIMDDILRYNISVDESGKPITLRTDQYEVAINDAVGKEWKKSVMGKDYDQFRKDLIADIQNQDPITAANWLKREAATQRGIAEGKGPTADKAARKAKIYTEVANKVDDLTYSAVPQKNINRMFDDTIDEFKTRAAEARTAGNRKYADAYERLADELSKTERTIAKYRSFKKDFVKSSQLAEISRGAQSGSLEAGYKRGNVIGRVVNTIAEEPINRALAFAGGKLSDIGDAVDGSSAGIAGKAAGNAGKAIGKAAEMLNNETITGSALGRFATMAGNRRIGQGEAQAVENRAALQDATQQMQDIQSNYENSMLQAQQAYNQAQQTQNSIPSTLDRISVGMERALAAGDINAYSTLANLYKQAAQMYELQNPTATKSKDKALSATQSKALTGLQQLQTLANMTPDLGTALANSPLGGVVDMLGGNDYANQAKSLSLTLGYLQSGANITPREAENIGKSYIPTAYDSEQVRQQKLSRAEQLLRNYLADTSALQ